MRNTRCAALAALGFAGVAAAVGAQASPVTVHNPLLNEVAIYTYFWGGQQYCWYDDAWRGPGWYWCGYAVRPGYGWGGPWGWHGWAGGHPYAYYHRGFYHHGGWYGGGWHGHYHGGYHHGGGWHGHHHDGYQHGGHHHH
jgi:hypothetical protein